MTRIFLTLMTCVIVAGSAMAEEGGPRPKALSAESTISGFHIGKFEVSQQLFQAVMGWDHSYFAGEGYPVNNGSWINAQRVIERLNAMTGMNFRLPTEAEWEYAAKGGMLSKGYKYSGSNNIDEVVWYAGNGERRPHPSGNRIQVGDGRE